ncbi:glycoside hydrolase family 2 protein [Nocardiopsis coralli]|uniref:glycoside hydrolase family 2 protein n=1 Tax=Nocardiopsis coralli TaxID=2772213 RepID=UPI0038B3307E
MTHHPPAKILSRSELSEGWTLSAVSGPVPESMTIRDVPARVPGCVHTDLMAAGLIPDPFLDDNESLLQWIGKCDWEYRTTFRWRPGEHDRHDLVFHGLDTVAEIRLNGALVGNTANMHRTYRFDVRGGLVSGENELRVRFSSPVRYADAQSLRLGYRPQVNHHPFNAIRKMACSFGWDWGIDTASSGIWRPLHLESWSTVRIAQVRPVVDVEAGLDHGASSPLGRVTIEVDLERGISGDACVDAVLTGHGSQAVETVSVAAGESSAAVTLEVPDVRLWWPRSHGDQPLYDVEVRVTTPEGEEHDRWNGRIGFRTVRLDTTPDEHGTPFTFVINGRPVWIRGANWIPDDAFPQRITRERHADRIAQAEAANMNLLRVWGGGIYESDDFYDLCDERGILVWQDFAFACAAYSENEPLRGEVEAEACDNVSRLMRHPALVLWNGSNENIWGMRAWGFLKRLDGKSWGLDYYERLLPAVVAELDPGREYTPSSPWSGDSPIDMDRDANDPDHGSMHSWEVWNRQDWPHYRDTVPRFMAEFGWQGPPTWSTLTRAIGDDPLTPESPGMQTHQKAMEGNNKLTDGLVSHVPLPDDMDDWHWAMSWNQATAVRVALEHLRSWTPRCMGAVVWQLNDCWPVTSWAAVDGDGRRKPLFYAMQHAFADRLLTIQPRDGVDTGLAAVVVNDDDRSWSGDLVLRRLDFDGTELDTAKVSVCVAARATDTVELPENVVSPRNPSREVVAAHLDESSAAWYFVEPRESGLEAAELNVSVSTAEDTAHVHVTAVNLVRDLALLVDRVHPEAVVDRMMVDLLPGESTTFHVRMPSDADPDMLSDRNVLRSLNDLVTEEGPAR